MSLLDLGAQCSHPHCTTIDFLPTLCPACALPFCGAHISAHVTADNLSRSDASGSSDTVCAGAGSSAGAAAGEVGRGQERQREEWALRVECEVEGCGRRAMEGVAGLTIEASETTVGADGAAAGQGMEEDREVAVIAKRIRCAGCGKAFCVSCVFSLSSQPLQTTPDGLCSSSRKPSIHHLSFIYCPSERETAMHRCIIPAQRHNQPGCSAIEAAWDGVISSSWK